MTRKYSSIVELPDPEIPGFVVDRVKPQARFLVHDGKSNLPVNVVEL